MDARSIATASVSALRSVSDEVREYFVLRDAETRATELTEEQQREITRALDEATEARRAGATLFRSSATARGLRLTCEAYRRVRPFADASSAKEPLVTEVDAALARPLPELDAQVTREHAQLFERVSDAESALRARLAPLALDRRGRTRLRRHRAAKAVAALAAILVVVLLWSRRERTFARASASRSVENRPSRVLDGSQFSHWLMPDHTLGWIEFDLVPPRRVTTVSILNGFDPPQYGVQDFRLEAYAHGKLVKTFDATFLGQPAKPRPTISNVPFPTLVDVERIRLVVKSHRELGAGLAEVVIR